MADETAVATRCGGDDNQARVKGRCALRHVERDWSLSHVADPELLPVFERIYEDTDAHWEAYHLCEDLVDLESQFQLWRFRHMRTVMRIIGFKRGTGGSSGVGFLKQALELTFFPELFEVRTVIGMPGKPDLPY